MTPYSAISANKRKTYFIIFFFFILIATLGYLFGKAFDLGFGFVGVALIFAGAANFISYYYSDKIILSMSGAHPADKDTHRALIQAVENMSIASGLPQPKVYVINDSAPNAFATGRDPQHAVVVATTGILEKLRDVELEGVIAHEISHIKNYDIRLLGVVTILVGTIALASDVFLRTLWLSGDRDRRGNGIFMIIAILAAMLAPIAAMLLHLAVSRKREFLADADGALLTRYPEGLASALEKIAADNEKLEAASSATAHLYIENPFKSGERRNSFFINIFSTHPPVAERIKILRSM